MSENTVKEYEAEQDAFAKKAVTIKAKFAACSDREVCYFADSLYFSKFESVGEHVKSIANKYDPDVPF